MRDLTQPFMAIVPDAKSGGYFDRTDAVYLVNPLEETLKHVYEGTSGYFSAGDDLLQAQEKRHGPFEVAPGGALLLEHISEDELDEVVCLWIISYELGTDRTETVFSAGKGLSDATHVDVCPILNRGALILD